MPIVSEHPRSIDVIRRLSDECDTDLARFVDEYAERRRIHRQDSEARRSVIRRLEDEDRADMSWRELVALLDARETAAHELRDELRLMDKELMLLKREMRRTRRKLVEATGTEELEPEHLSAPGVPDMLSIWEYFRRVREGRSLPWLKPWLRSFLPSSA